MRYILLITVIMGGLLSFNSYAKDSCPAIPVPFNYDPFLTHYVPINRPDSSPYQVQALDIHGCTYVITSNYCPDDVDLSSSGSVCTATSMVLLSDYGNENSPIVSDDWKDTQLDRYCAQAGKCNSKGEPVNLSDWLKFKDKDDAEHEKPGDDTGTPDGSDTGTGTTGGSVSGSVDGSSSGSSTPSPSPSPSESEKPYPGNAYQMLNSFSSCSGKLNSFPIDSEYDNAYNAVARNCNSILEHLRSSLPYGKIISPSDDYHKFLIKDKKEGLLSCRRATDNEKSNFINNGFYPAPEVIGYSVQSNRYRTGLLMLNYGGGDAADLACDSAYHNYVTSNDRPSSSGVGSRACMGGYVLLSGGKFCQRRFTIVNSECVSGTHGDTDTGLCVSDGDISGSSGSLSDKPLSVDSADGSLVALPGNGHAASGDDGNGDVVAAINAFHADANKHHEETMNKLDISDGAVEGIKNGLASDINELISSTRKEISDSYDAGVSELKSIFGDIDSYIPDIKLTFDLPTQFIAGIQGHCVPLVFDFNITLVGLPFYHLHAEGVQACKLYDLYIRSIVEYMFYFITALACRRIFTRAAEFISSN